VNMDWHDLIQRYISGTITEAETKALERQLETDAALRDWYLDAVHLDSALEVAAEAAELALSLPVPFSQRALTRRSSRPSLWLSWRPLAAAAAGIVLGAFCASVVFAYVVPALEKVTTVLQESFESGPAPRVTGVPIETGHWSGDYTEVVGEQQGVKPESGSKMLRFLRADYEGKPNPEENHVGDLYRLIDMRPYREEFADGASVAQVSAAFNASEFPLDQRFDCSLTLYALDAESATNGSTRSGIKRSEAPLGIQKSRMTLDHHPATWQRLRSELRLPPSTDFLMVRICIQYPLKSAPRPTFTGHYVDDVRLTMARRNPLP
jgi:hypothetical protein